MKKEIKITSFENFSIKKLTFLGFIFGAAFPFFSYFLQNDVRSLYLVICTAPIVLGLVFYFIGVYLWKSKIYLEALLEVSDLKNQTEMTASRLEEAQKIAKIGSWKFDFESNEINWSDEHYRIFEIENPTPKEQLYKIYRSKIHPEDIPELDRLVDRAKNLGEDFVYNHRVYLDGGIRIKHVRGIGKVTKDKRGKPIYISGTCQDLSDLVTLQEQNQFILKSMGIGIWKFNPITQNLQWDHSLYELYELNPKDFSGDYHAWESSLSPEAKQRAVEELGLALSGKKDFDTIFEILTKSGKRKQIGGKGVVIRNDKNEPIMMYGINWDKTKEILAQKEIESVKILLQNVIDASPSTIFVKDLSGKYLICNESYSRLHGKSPSELIGKNLYELFPKEAADKMSANDKKIINSRSSKTFEEQIPYGNHLRWNLVSLFPVYSINKELIGIGGIITDIQETKDIQNTYQREIEFERSKSLQNAKLASLGEMSAGIAHEINNPLAIVSSGLSLLTKFRENEEKFLSKIESIKKATYRIEKIVKGLKKFSRSSEGVVHKNELLQEIINEVMILTEAKAKRHSTSVNLTINDHLIIHCDEVEVEQVLVNLINNAIDAVKNKTERWVQIKSFDLNDEIVIQIIDSGNGITPEIESKLFEPFFTTKPIGEGTGLGLSIAKGILDQHKAKILINHDFKNTCFELRFPKIEDYKIAA